MEILSHSCSTTVVVEVFLASRVDESCLSSTVVMGRSFRVMIPLIESSSILGRVLSVGVYCQACSGLPLAVVFVGRDRLLYNSIVQEIQRFRQVRAASLRNTLFPM